MTVINQAKKELSITFKSIQDDEDKGYLADSIIEAIRWNSLCDDSYKYEHDRLNILPLTSFLKQVLATVIKDDKPLTISFDTDDPAKEIHALRLAIIASFRWCAGCFLIDRLEKRSADNLCRLASYLEEMV